MSEELEQELAGLKSEYDRLFDSLQESIRRRSVKMAMEGESDDIDYMDEDIREMESVLEEKRQDIISLQFSINPTRHKRRNTELTR